MKFSGLEKSKKISAGGNSKEEQLVLNLEGKSEKPKKNEDKQQLTLGMKGGAIKPKLDKDGRFDRLGPTDLGPDE